MVKMEHIIDSPNVRKGRFLWMEQREKESFVHDLKVKIAKGYFNSDLISARIAEELASVMNDVVEVSG